jgi:hypothetical protein
MLNIFEHPYLAAVMAAGLFLVHRIIRAFKPDKCRNIYLMIPVFIFVLGFGIDYFIKTDLEKINTIISRVQKTIAMDDISPIKDLLCSNYLDLYHPTPQSAINHLNSTLDYAPIETAKIIEKHLEINGNTAKIKVKALLLFKPQAPLGMTSILFTAQLEKQPDKSWKICTSELLEVGKQPIGYNKI